MTIRYTCTGCESVLKIKDEKAGTKGRCPKCKAEFIVPQPDEGEGIELDSSESPGSASSSSVSDPVVDSVDMPFDLTPEVEASADFDPTDVLGAPQSASRAASFGSGSSAGDKKPSVAELMRDFEATKKKDKKEKSAPEVARPVSPAASSAVHTSGSAADALSRAYQQKRESSSAPAVRPQDVKAAEQKALLMDFIKTRGAPIVVAVLALGYGYYWFLNRDIYTGPPLVAVSGSVSKSGQPAPGVSLTFMPTVKDPTDLRSSSSGMTDSEGNYVLQYVAGHEGAPVGEYDVQIFTADGNPAILVEGETHVTVREDGANEFKFSL